MNKVIVFPLIVLLVVVLVGCTSSSSHFYHTWSLHRGLSKNINGELVPSPTLDMMVGFGLLNINLHDPDWGSIRKNTVKAAQKILNQENKYHYCPRGYLINPDWVNFERHYTYAMLTVRCRK